MGCRTTGDKVEDSRAVEMTHVDTGGSSETARKE